MFRPRLASFDGDDRYSAKEGICIHEQLGHAVTMHDYTYYVYKVDMSDARAMLLYT
jgi:hypothetical protein